MRALLLNASALAMAASLVIGASAAHSQEPGTRPRVSIIIEAGSYDACGGNGVIEGLDPSGDGFLAVRSGPGTQHGEIDRLYNGEEVYLCVISGQWIGIVYTRQHRDCNVTTSWVTTQPYTGPCKSGWVHRNWVRLYAG